jgi:hypothetical protein
MSPSFLKEGKGVVVTTPSLLAKEGPREVNSRGATTQPKPHTTPANRLHITPSLLAKEGTREVNSREATTQPKPHTTPANRQDIDHPSLFKEGPRVVKIPQTTPHRGEVDI